MSVDLMPHSAVGAKASCGSFAYEEAVGREYPLALTVKRALTWPGTQVFVHPVATRLKQMVLRYAMSCQRGPRGEFVGMRTAEIQLISAR